MKVLAYVIESGWAENPIWYCPVSLGVAGKVRHLHTTRQAGSSPSIFSGKVSGILFEAKGCLWPIEARKGSLMIAESTLPLERIDCFKEAELNWQPVDKKDVIKILIKTTSFWKLVKFLISRML